MGGDFISLTTNEVYKQLKKKPKKVYSESRCRLFWIRGSAKTKNTSVRLAK